MEYTAKQIRAFRYWIQGYSNFYEPIAQAYFEAIGYEVVDRPAKVSKNDIGRVTKALFDGHKQLVPEIDQKSLITALEKRARLQPDLILRKDGLYYLVELKSWGGSGTGVFDLVMLRREFLNKPIRAAYLLLDWLEKYGPIHSKFLVVSSKCDDEVAVSELLRRSFAADVEILYLDEMYRLPQIAGVIERQMHYLDAAVAELKQAFGPEMKL